MDFIVAEFALDTAPPRSERKLYSLSSNRNGWFAKL